MIKENSGRDVRLHADDATRLDRDIRTGDRVVVITSTMPSDASMYSIYKLGNSNVLQGEVVRIDGDGYLIRESGGSAMLLPDQFLPPGFFKLSNLDQTGICLVGYM